MMEKSNMFSVTPVTQEINLEPGQVYEGMVTVANPVDSTADFSYKMSVVPYTVVGEEYTADMKTTNNRTQIVDWIKIEGGQGTVKPNEKDKVPFTITVPEDAPAGSQYAAIVVTQDAEATSGEGAVIENVFEIASVIYADVAGVTEHNANILANEVPGFTVSVPVMVEALLDNQGNTHESATVALKARNVITGEEILPKGENNGQYTELIMPETTRRIEREVQDLPMVGIVYLEQTIYYNGVVSVEGKNLIICPVWLMGLALLVIIGVVFGVVKLVKRKKRAVI